MHIPVLLQPAVDALAIKPDGLYIDGTFGRGGHAQLILSQLSDKGRLWVFDKDPEAIAAAKALADSRMTIVHDSFAAMVDHSELQGQVDGILLDLGVSSPQLDDAERGFSFMQDGPLDMRMDTTRGVPLSAWLNDMDDKTLADVIYQYGEERFSRPIARAILQRHHQQPFARTLELADCIAAAMPRRDKHKHPATRTFQALRIAINHELDDLQQWLTGFESLLAPAGRAVVLSFHSLEDRLVKRRFTELVKGKEVPRGLPVTEAMLSAQQAFAWVAKQHKPDDAELDDNIRARSVVMRAIEKMH